MKKKNVVIAFAFTRRWCCTGMLPVAYGMAAVGGTGLAVAPALLASFGIISAYTMISVGRACQRTKRWSFSGLWTDLVGKKSAWVSERWRAVRTGPQLKNYFVKKQRLAFSRKIENSRLRSTTQRWTLTIHVSTIEQAVLDSSGDEIRN